MICPTFDLSTVHCYNSHVLAAVGLPL